MLTRGLVAKIFDTSTMLRWTDHASPREFTILGKQAHMMAAAWIYGKALQSRGREVDWGALIDYGLYELLRKAVLTDIKSQVFRDLYQHQKSRQALMGHVENCLRDDLRAVSETFFNGFVRYFKTEAEHKDNLGDEYKLLRCASNYATRWEYSIISKVDQVAYTGNPRRALDDEKASYGDFLPRDEGTDVDPDSLEELLDLCGRLRFQTRWAQTPIVPRRPVMDHQLIVAALTHLATRSLRISAARTRNNFFGALFHDLGEILTRDIVSPVKNISGGIKDVIDAYEREQYKKHLARLVPEDWRGELEAMVLHPFEQRDGYDGNLVKACDNFAAFLEAYYSVKYGTYSPELKRALIYLYECRRSIGARPDNVRSDGEDTPDLMAFDVAYELCFYEIEPQLRRI